MKQKNYKFVDDDELFNPPDEQQAAHAPVSRFRRKYWVLVLPPALACLIVFLIVAYYQKNHPDKMEEVLIQVDIFGLTEAGAKEQERLKQIQHLTIPYEKKEVLRSRTVFIGATQEMVYLALGGPRATAARKRRDSDMVNEVWIYYFPNESRPTMLEFENNELISAYKGSALDLPQNSLSR